MCSELVPLANEGWAVCNQSVVHSEAPETPDRIRISCDVTLVVRQRYKDPMEGTARGNVLAELTYIADIDLGGWVPSQIVAELMTRDWPRAMCAVCDTARKIVKKRGLEDRDVFVDCDS